MPRPLILTLSFLAVCGAGIAVLWDFWLLVGVIYLMPTPNQIGLGLFSLACAVFVGAIAALSPVPKDLDLIGFPPEGGSPSCVSDSAREPANALHQDALHEGWGGLG